MKRGVSCFSRRYCGKHDRSAIARCCGFTGCKYRTSDKLFAFTECGERKAHDITNRATGTVFLLTAFVAGRTGRIAVTVLAGAVFLYRTACAFGVFFTG